MLIEARYIDVIWDDSKRLVGIKKNPESLPIEKVGSAYHLETITYPKTFFYIGFRILEDKILHVPYFSLGDIEEELMKIEDPISHEIWWIQQGIWKGEKKKYVCESYRTAGILQLNIQDQILQVTNNTNNFSVEELEYFLLDFKNNLWEIVLNANSMIGANVEKKNPNIFSEQAVEYIDRFIDAGNRIIKEPKYFLKEIQGMVMRAKVKPVPRTFRELTTKQDPQQLTSRLHQTSYDNAENRYVHYCVDRLFFLLSKMTDVADNLREQFNSLAKQYQDEMTELKSVKNKIISKQVFELELAELREKLKKINEEISACLSDVSEPSNPSKVRYSYSSAPSVPFDAYEFNNLGRYGNYDDYYTAPLPKSEYATHTFSLEKPAFSGNGNAFLCNYLDGKYFATDPAYSKYHENGVLNKNGKKSLIVKYPPAVYDQLKNIKDIYKLRDVVISVTGHVEWKNRDDRSYCVREWLSVEKIEIINSNLHEEIARRTQLHKEYEAKNWQVPYTYMEKEELKQEIIGLNSRAGYYDSASEKYLALNSQLKGRQNKLRALKLAFQQLGIAKSHVFPNNMVFVQNPEYSAIHSHFKAIQNQSNIDNSQLESLIALEHIGLIAISTLYERWVLLQIIKVLTEYFHLPFEDGWQSKLVKAILNNQYNIEFKTSMTENELDFVLTYEKQLDNNKRPDFVLDVFYRQYEFDKGTQSWSGQNQRSSRLVMDAKFYDTESDAKLMSTLNELYGKKNYSNNEQDRVFIIHPSPHSVRSLSSPFKWRDNCDYGHISPVNHKKGHIFLIPSRQHRRSIDNLKRLIILHLQDLVGPLYREPTSEDDYIKVDWHNYFCPNCGSGRDQIEVEHQLTERRGNSWLISCNSCHRKFKENFCYSCKTRLFKNGLNWTYHRAFVEELANCRCPNCDADLSQSKSKSKPQYTPYSNNFPRRQTFEQMVNESFIDAGRDYE